MLKSKKRSENDPNNAFYPIETRLPWQEHAGDIEGGLAVYKKISMSWSDLSLKAINLHWSLASWAVCEIVEYLNNCLMASGKSSLQS